MVTKYYSNLSSIILSNTGSLNLDRFDVNYSVTYLLSLLLSGRVTLGNTAKRITFVSELNTTEGSCKIFVYPLQCLFL